MIVAEHIFITEFHVYLYFLLLWTGIVSDVEHHSEHRPDIIITEKYKIKVVRDTSRTINTNLPKTLSRALIFHINEYLGKPFVIEWLTWTSNYYYLPRKPIITDVVLTWKNKQFLFQGILISKQMSSIKKVVWSDEKYSYQLEFKPNTAMSGGINKEGVFIPNQLSIGTCGVCSTITMINHAFEKYKLRFSILYLYYTTRVYIMKVPAIEDSGIEIVDALAAINKYGLVEDASWSYDITTMGNKPSIAILREGKQFLMKYKITMIHIKTMKEIRHYINKGHYILADAGFDFDSYLLEVSKNKGISPIHRNPRSVYGGYFDHSITICDYDDNKELIKYINSWGPDFGDQGYGYLPYTYMNDHLIDNMYICKVKKLADQ